MFHRSTNEIGDSLADQDENDVIRNQFHGRRCPDQFPVQSSIGRMLVRGEGTGKRKVV